MKYTTVPPTPKKLVKCENCAFANNNFWDSDKLVCEELSRKVSMTHPDSGVYVQQSLNWGDEPIFEVEKDFGCNLFKQK